MSNKTYIGIIVALALLIGVMYLVTGKTTSPPPQPVAPPRPTTIALYGQLLASACTPARGNAKAQWTMIEAGDFQCPICGSCRPYIERIIDRSGGQVKLYFTNFPLQQHAFGVPAALASVAAQQQNKFWPMYDALYRHQKQLNKAGIDAAAADAGLNMTEFHAALSSRATEEALDRQRSLGMEVPIMATPTFLLHQDGTQTVTTYVGLYMSEDGRTPGLRQLMQNTPWGTKFAPSEIPPPKKKS